jgi:hypothetical protein
MSPEDAIAFVRTKRAGTLDNDHFLRCLKSLSRIIELDHDRQ